MILRPQNLSEIVGNDKLKKCIAINLDVSRRTKNPIPHTLFQGHWGTGKTTFSEVISKELGKEALQINAASLTKPRHVLELILRIKENDVVFIDEIHRLDRHLEEIFYPVMEDNILTLAKSRPGVNSFVKQKIPPFTLIGATTDIGLLSGALLSRFKQHYFLELYSIEDIKQIILNNAKKLNLIINEQVADIIAKRSKKIPRIANSRLEWIANYCISNGITNPTVQHIEDAMSLIEIDEHGLDKNDRLYLKIVTENNDPIGLQSISSISRLSEETITKYIEPFLVDEGFIKMDKRGRIATTNIKTIEKLSEQF